MTVIGDLSVMLSYDCISCLFSAVALPQVSQRTHTPTNRHTDILSAYKDRCPIYCLCTCDLLSSIFAEVIKFCKITSLTVSLLALPSDHRILKAFTIHVK